MNRFFGSSAVAVYLTVLILGLGIARLVYEVEDTRRFG